MENLRFSINLFFWNDFYKKLRIFFCILEIFRVINKWRFSKYSISVEFWVLKESFFNSLTKSIVTKVAYPGPGFADTINYSKFQDIKENEIFNKKWLLERIKILTFSEKVRILFFKNFQNYPYLLAILSLTRNLFFFQFFKKF